MQINLDTVDPYHLVYKGQKGSLVNMDTGTNSILVGPDEGAMYSANPECFTLGPLNSGYCTGDKDLWGIALTGSPQVAFMEGLQNWQPSPAQVQAQLNALGLAKETTQQIVKGNTADIFNLHATGKTIAVESSQTGVPALRLANNLGNGTATAIGGGANTNLISNMSITQTAVEMEFFIGFAGGPTVPFVLVQPIWTDPSGTTTFVEDPFTMGGSVGGTIPYLAHMPTRGATLTVKVTNLDPAVITFVTWSINQISQDYTRLKVLQEAAGTVFGFASPGQSPLLGNLASTAPTIAISSTVTRLAAVWFGKATLTVDAQVAGTSVIVRLTDPASLYNMSGAQTFATVNVTVGNVVQQVSLPAGPVLVSMQNPSAANPVTPSVTLTREES